MWHEFAGFATRGMHQPPIRRHVFGAAMANNVLALETWLASGGPFDAPYLLDRLLISQERAHLRFEHKSARAACAVHTFEEAARHWQLCSPKEHLQNFCIKP